VAPVPVNSGASEDPYIAAVGAAWDAIEDEAEEETTTE